MKWAVDPGIDGDVYGDKPFLYGNALSSVNVLRVGGKVDEVEKGGAKGGIEEDAERSIEEGGEEGGEKLREELGVPVEADQRKKWFLAHGRTEGWVWENRRVYWCDFFNPYLDFNREFFPDCLSFPFLDFGSHRIFFSSPRSNVLNQYSGKQIRKMEKVMCGLPSLLVSRADAKPTRACTIQNSP